MKLEARDWSSPNRHLEEPKGVFVLGLKIHTQFSIIFFFIYFFPLIIFKNLRQNQFETS